MIKMPEISKKIYNVDEFSKKFIIDLLEDEQTHGLDIDCVYFNNNKWIILEFCKCDTVDPHDSHPNRYAFNWKKFATLFELSKKLDGNFLVINYSHDERWKDHVKIITVNNVDYSLIKEAIGKGRPSYVPYLESKEEKLSLSEFKKVFKSINQNSSGPWGNSI